MDLEVVFPGDAEMEDQFGRAPLASLQAPSFGTGTASARSLLQAPHNMRLDGTLHRSSIGARVPSPSSVGRLAPFVMAEDAVGATFFFPTLRETSWRS